MMDPFDPSAGTGGDHAAPDSLPVAEFAFPGPLRDRLVAAILDGSKTATTSTLVEYDIEEEPLPQVGARQLLIDSAGQPVAIIETTAVQVVRLADVDLRHARDEGEGHDSVAGWRAAHEAFWTGTDMRGYLNDPTFTVTDDTQVVLERLRVVELLTRS